VGAEWIVGMGRDNLLFLMNMVTIYTKAEKFLDELRNWESQKRLSPRN
jgi:hypothetical protein